MEGQALRKMTVQLVGERIHAFVRDYNSTSMIEEFCKKWDFEILDKSRNIEMGGFDVIARAKAVNRVQKYLTSLKTHKSLSFMTQHKGNRN